MTDRRPGLYARLLVSGRLAALVALSVVAGGIGGAWAVAGAPGLERVTVMTVSDDGTATADDPARKSAGPTSSKVSKEPKEPKAAKSGRPTDAGKPSGAGKPPKAAKAAKPAGSGDKGQGVHGRCVSAVATSDATGGPNDNHGGAVSAAAKSCPRPTPAATANR